PRDTAHTVSGPDASFVPSRPFLILMPRQEWNGLSGVRAVSCPGTTPNLSRDRDTNGKSRFAFELPIEDEYIAPMQSAEIRRRFTSYFTGHAHRQVPS